MKGLSTYLLLLLLSLALPLSAQTAWKPSDTKDFLQALNKARQFMSQTKQFAFVVHKTMSKADGDKSILRKSKMIFKRQDQLMLIKGEDIVILQNASLLLSMDSMNQVIVLDKAMNIDKKTVLSDDIDAAVHGTYKQIQKYVSGTVLKYKLKFMDEADTTILHEMEMDFDPIKGNMLRSMISYGAAATYELKGNKSVTGKLKTETLFVPIDNAKALTEAELGITRYVLLDNKNKATLTKKYSQYKLIDQRNLRE
jgi:hypothetical protein